MSDLLLLHHCWMLIPDHRLDDWLSLSHLSWRRRRRNTRCPFMNGTAIHEWTMVYDARNRSYVQEKLPKKPFRPLYIWRPLHTSPRKWRNPRIEQSSTFLQMFTPIGARYLPLGKKYIVFSQGTPLGATVPCYRPTVLESSRRANVTPHAFDIVTYCFRNIRGKNLGF